MATITFEGSSYALAPGETVLAGLERHGVEIPSSCRSGVCQSCMMKAASGAPPADAAKGLRDTLRAQGMFLACSCVPSEDLSIERPAGPGQIYPSQVLGRRRLSERTVELTLARPADFDYFAGQFVNLVRPGNIVRSYSLASVARLDDALRLHIALMPGGRMSGWACDEAASGDDVGIMGPLGNCFYVPGAPGQPLFLFGTGTGLAPLYGILRDALAQGHTGPIHLFHGSPVDDGLYLHDDLHALAASHANVQYHPCTLQAPVRDGVTQGDMTAISLERCGDLTGYRAYLCGNPEIVRAMQKKCFLAGASMREIFADAFLPAAK